MKIVFFSNFINHHQYPVARELFKITNGDYWFVETEPMPAKFKNGGYPDYSNEKFVLKAWESDKNMRLAVELSVNADVAMFDGHEPLKFEKIRSKKNKKGLSFEVSERWFKKGIVNFFSPRFLKWYFNYLTLARYSNVYKLCCSGFVPNDMKLLGAFHNRCYKWGYITDVSKDCMPINDGNSNVIKIMWCARFLTLKHPELVIQMASILHKLGYNFVVDIYGGEGNCAKGEKIFSKSQLENLIQNNGLQSIVNLKGSLSNSAILSAMQNHDIFLFTSDKREGWGAVANESLACGCVLVSSDAVGSTPYLVKEGFNGFSFKNKNINTLTEKVKYLLDHPDELILMKGNSALFMRELWSPENAATALVQLINDLTSNRETSIIEGPCSKALPV